MRKSSTNYLSIELLELKRAASKAIILVSFIAAFFAFGALTAKAQDDDRVTIYFYSDNPSEFDLQKVADKSASTLSQNGISVTAVRKISSADLASLGSNFEIGESAKLVAKVIPSPVIQGTPLSSYPVTIVLEVIGTENSTAISSIKKSARSQHTNPASGLTNAVSRAMESALKEIADDIIGLKPWNQDSVAALQKNDVAPKPEPTAAAPITTQAASTASAPVASPTPIAPIPTPTATAVQKVEPGTCNEESRNSSLSAIPNTLKPGGSLRLVSCYSITSNGTTKTNFATILSSPNGRKSIVKEESSEKTSGYWKAEFDINIPEKTTAGIYTLIQLISHEGRVETLEEKMIVR